MVYAETLKQGSRLIPVAQPAQTIQRGAILRVRNRIITKALYPASGKIVHVVPLLFLQPPIAVRAVEPIHIIYILFARHQVQTREAGPWFELHHPIVHHLKRTLSALRLNHTIRGPRPVYRRRGGIPKHRHATHRGRINLFERPLVGKPIQHKQRRCVGHQARHPPHL